MSNNTEAYVYFDYSDSAFKAIAWDITSDQFYPVGQIYLNSYFRNYFYRRKLKNSYRKWYSI